VGNLFREHNNFFFNLLILKRGICLIESMDFLKEYLIMWLYWNGSHIRVGRLNSGRYFKYLKLSYLNIYLWQELQNNSLILTVDIKKKIYGKSPKFLKSIFFETNFQNVKTLKFGNLLSFLGKIKSLFDFFL
jgi:hypothetical protein